MAVTLTEAAARHVQKYIDRRGKGLGLRLGVKTSGCSGMAYKLEFADEIHDDDQVYESFNVKVIVDEKEGDRGRKEPSLSRRDGTRLHARRPERGLPLPQPQRKVALRLRGILPCLTFG